MLFDSHAHLNDERFDEDREELISSLQEKGVDLVVNPGACIKTSIESVELANKYDFIYDKHANIVESVDKYMVVGDSSFYYLNKDDEHAKFYMKNR